MLAVFSNEEPQHYHFVTAPSPTGSEKGISQVLHNSTLLGTDLARENLIPKITHLTSLWKHGKN